MGATPRYFCNILFNFAIIYAGRRHCSAGGGAQRQSGLSTSSWHRVHTVNQYERRRITSRKNGRNAWKIE